MIRCLLILSMVLLNVMSVFSQALTNRTDTLNTYNLNEVVIVGEKPQIKNKNGAITVDLNKLIKGKAVSNIYESLSYLPGITKDISGNLSLAGAKDLTILINGKKEQLSNENLIALLQSYPTDRLKDVEIMYSTPAKYHVEGASINIIMKKNSVLDGLQGQIGLNYIQNHYSNGAANIASTYSSDKWSFDVMYNYILGKNWSHQLIDSYHLFNDEYLSIKQNEQTTTSGQNHNGHIGFNWEPIHDNSISVSYNFQFDPIRYARNSSTGTLGGYITSKNYMSPNKFNNVNIDYKSSFGLTIGGSYTNYKENSKTLMFEEQQENTLKNYYSSQDINKYHFYANQSHQIKKWGINYGVSVDYANDFSSQSFNSSNNGNDFSTKIQEYSADAYFGIERSFKNGLSFSASVKGDYYHINDYTKWWVSSQVAITYMKNPNHVFQVDISTSKDYPAYWEIHGAETWLNNYMVIMGNSLLKPSYTYENQLVYIYHQKYMAVLYYNYTDNAIVQLPYQSANSLNLIYQTLNYKYNQMFGMMLRVPFNLGQILQSTVTINGYYTHNKVDNFHNLQINREKFSLYTDLTNSIRLSSKYPIYITLNAAVLTSSLQGIAELSDIWKIDLGFKWTTLKGSADLIVSGGDILNTWSPKLVVNKYNQNLRMDTYDMTRQFKVSFVYRFNSFKPKTYETNKSRFGISK